MASCLRCGATARVSNYQISFIPVAVWDADLCPRHFTQILDFLQVATANWTPGGEPKEKHSPPVPVVTDLDAVPKRRGRPKGSKNKSKAPKPEVINEAVVDTTPSGGIDLAEVRAWARANDVPVSQRGRVAAGVIDAYAAATGGTPGGGEKTSLDKTELPEPADDAPRRRKKKASVLFSSAG